MGEGQRERQTVLFLYFIIKPKRFTMSFTKQPTPAPEPLPRLWHIYAHEAQEEKDLLTQIVMFYLVEGGNDRCNDPQHKQDVHCLYTNLCGILEQQAATLPNNPQNK